MRIKLALIATLLFLTFFIPTAYANPIPVDGHIVQVCAKITNLNEFPDIILIAQESWGGTDVNVAPYLVNDSECLHTMVEWYYLKFFAVDKNYFNEKGIDNIDYDSDNNSLISSTTINPSRYWVGDTNPLVAEEIYYKIAGFLDDNLILYKSKRISSYNNGTPNTTETFEAPYIPDLRLTLQPEPNNPVPIYRGYVIESNTCVFKQQTTPLPTPNYANLTECESHLQACTTQYEPVCGVDNNTYSNSCFANAANVTINCTGSCPCTRTTPKILEMIKCFFQRLIKVFSFGIINPPDWC